MASIKNRTKTVEVAEETATPVVGGQQVNVRVRKVNFENRRTLKAFVSLTVEGYPIFGKVSLTEKEDEKFNVLFPSHKGKDGRYYNYLNPITKEVREDFIKATASLFEAVYSDENFDEASNPYTKETPFEAEGITFTYPQRRDVPAFPALVGEASFVTDKLMAVNDVELHQKDDGNFFLVFPADHRKVGEEWKDYPHVGPASKEASEAILTAAIEAYNAAE